MKQSSIIILLSMLMSMVSTKASADSNIKVANADGVIITYYWGMNNELCVTWPGNYMYDKNIKYSGNIVIPESVEYEGVSYPVTTIGEAAFNNCSELESITIPNSVKTIGKSAFMGCSGLTSITIPNSVTAIGKVAFSGCNDLTTIIVEEGNTVYDSRDNCNAIIETSTNTLIIGCQNTIIPNSVTTIGEYAFEDYNVLTSVTIPNSVTSIGRYAFYGCI